MPLNCSCNILAVKIVLLADGKKFKGGLAMKHIKIAVAAVLLLFVGVVYTTDTDNGR